MPALFLLVIDGLQLGGHPNRLYALCGGLCLFINCMAILPTIYGICFVCSCVLFPCPSRHPLISEIFCSDPQRHVYPTYDPQRHGIGFMSFKPPPKPPTLPHRPSTAAPAPDRPPAEEVCLHPHRLRHALRPLPAHLLLHPAHPPAGMGAVLPRPALTEIDPFDLSRLTFGHLFCRHSLIYTLWICPKGANHRRIILFGVFVFISLMGVCFCSGQQPSGTGVAATAGGCTRPPP